MYGIFSELFTPRLAWSRVNFYKTNLDPTVLKYWKWITTFIFIRTNTIHSRHIVLFFAELILWFFFNLIFEETRRGKKCSYCKFWHCSFWAKIGKDLNTRVNYFFKRRTGLRISFRFSVIFRDSFSIFQGSFRDYYWFLGILGVRDFCLGFLTSYRVKIVLYKNVRAVETVLLNTGLYVNQHRGTFLPTDQGTHWLGTARGRVTNGGIEVPRPSPPAVVTRSISDLNPPVLGGEWGTWGLLRWGAFGGGFAGDMYAYCTPIQPDMCYKF